MTLADLAPVANHLWQSTVFVGVVWLLSLMLRNNRAAVRYWLWLAASLKFLIPLSALVALGRLVEWRSATTIAQPNVTLLIDTIGQPFSGAVAVVAPSVTTQPSLTAVLPLAVVTIWFAGSAMHLLAWWVRWRRVARIVRLAKPLQPGRESEILRRVEIMIGLRQQVLVVTSDASLEPGIFGVLNPVLFWPRGIGSRMSDQQVQALFTHELCHVRRRDNLAAGLHMFAEAAFWFHPLMWWIEKRLVDERERACDEAVITFGSDPQHYAEAILKTCEYYAESPLVCVSGITGSDLRMRVEAIMRRSGQKPLRSWQAACLITCFVLAVGTPLVAGSMAARLAPQITSRENDSTLAFEVASIKPNRSSEQGYVGFRPGGRFTATRATLRELITLAFSNGSPLRESQLVGGPRWMATDRFDIEAKAAEAVTDAGGPSPQQLLGMVRNLLTERFALTVHYETRQLPILALVRANADRLGSRLRTAEWDCYAPVGTTPPPMPAGKTNPRCGVYGGPGRMTGRGMPLAMLVNGRLPRVLDRSIVDRSGLSGSFDWDLEWTPAPGEPSPPAGPGEPAEPPSDAPSLVTALQEQLGLKLVSGRGPVEVLVIDAAQRPTDDNARVTAPSLQLVSQSSTPVSAGPAFEVASIKPNRNVAGPFRMGFEGGTFSAIDVTIRQLVALAYGTERALPTFQLVGGPNWADSDRFDIIAKGQNASRSMLQALLKERFGLVVHNESRSLPIYALALARKDGKFDPELVRTSVDCGALRAGRANGTPTSSEARPSCGFVFAPGYVTGGAVTLAEFAAALSRRANRPVVDRTGIGGRFNLKLQWTPEELPRIIPGGPPPGAPPLPDPNGPSLFTALQEQLGLKLESTTGPVQVVVIDRVEQPTPD